jgi:hypothetical protein
MMSKKDYVLLADALNEVIWDRETDIATMTKLTMTLVARCSEQNPRFDKVRFIEQAWRNTSDMVS